MGFLLLFFFSYREKAKKDAAAVGNHVAKLLQSVGQVSCWVHCTVTISTSPHGEVWNSAREGLETWLLVSSAAGPICLSNENPCCKKTGVCEMFSQLLERASHFTAIDFVLCPLLFVCVCMCWRKICIYLFIGTRVHFRERIKIAL